MSDLIRRHDVIEALVNLTCFGIEEIEKLCDEHVVDSEGWLGGIRDAIREIQAIPSKESETKWIPVTERLPENDKAVLCTVQGYKDEHWIFTDCRYKNGIWETLEEPNYDYWTQLDDVLAWMPLPKPWRE